MEIGNQFWGTERIDKLMRQYAVPCIISLLVGALYNIVDQIFIANASYLGSYGNAIQRFRSQGIHVGLGTDISGGYSPSMYENIRQAVLVSRLLETGVNAQLPPEERGGLGEGTRLSLVESFWLATAGGAEALSLPLATFEPGCAFDLQVIDVKRPDSDLTGFGVFDEPIDRLARILHLSTPDNVRQVFSQGILVCDKDAR